MATCFIVVALVWEVRKGELKNKGEEGGEEIKMGSCWRVQRVLLAAMLRRVAADSGALRISQSVAHHVYKIRKIKDVGCLAKSFGSSSPAN